MSQPKRAPAGGHLAADAAGYSRVMAGDDRVALSTLDTEYRLHRGVSAITSPLSRLT